MAQVGALPVGETGAGNRPGEPGAGVLGVHAKANEGQFLFFPVLLAIWAVHATLWEHN